MGWDIFRRSNSQPRRAQSSKPSLRIESLEDRLAPAVLDAGFTEAPFVSASGLAGATGLAWAPDGSNRLYITRKAGDVRVIENGSLLPTAFSTDSVFTNSECGLLGITFDRDYVSNGYVYLFMTISNSEQQVVRYTDADKNNVADPGSRTVIVSGLPTVGNNHDGGGIGIGFDNKLYWGIGDLGNGSGVDLDLTSLASKIGRANLDGTVPSDNPFNDGAGSNNDYIWARGFRNPFTLTFQESTGKLWVNVAGTTYEQIFKVNASDHAGYNDFEGNQPLPNASANYIRPPILYRTNGADSRTIQPAASNGAVRNGNVVTISHAAASASTAFLQQGNKIVVSSVTDTSFNGTFDILSVISNTQFTYAQTGPNAISGGGTATTVDYPPASGGVVTGGTFLNSTSVPASYRGNFFFTDFVAGDVRRVSFDANSNVTSVNPFITDFSNGFANVVDAAVGPDGALYYVSAGGSNAVMRSAFTPTSQDLIVTPTYLALPEGGKVGFSVRLATAPVGNVTVTVARTAGSSDLSVFSGSTLTFTPSNFSTPQAVIVAAAQDADTVNDTATFSISSPSLATQTLDYTAIDTGIPNIVVSKTSLAFTEGGNSTFTVRLQDEPSGTVTVTVARTAGDTDVTVVGGATLTFTPQNYAAPQTLTIAAAEDADLTDDSATLSISALAAITRTVTVTVADNDGTPARLAGTAFLDINADGVQNNTTTDRGLSGRTIYLDTNDNRVLDGSEPTRTTDAQGRYDFGNLSTGVYDIREVLFGVQSLTGAAAATGGLTVNLTSGNDQLAVNLGHRFAASIYPTRATANLFTTVFPNTNTAYVYNVFRTLLGRDPTAGEEAYHVNALNSGYNRIDYATSIYNRDEQLYYQVDKIYQTTVKRPADAAGLAFWSDQIRRGLQPEWIVTQLVTAGEYTAAHPTNASFTQGLFNDILGRTANSVDITFWNNYLATRSRFQMAFALAYSSESYTRAVQDVFVQYLHREATSADVNNWVPLLVNRRIPVSRMTILLLASQEFATKALNATG